MPYAGSAKAGACPPLGSRHQRAVGSLKRRSTRYCPLTPSDLRGRYAEQIVSRGQADSSSNTRAYHKVDKIAYPLIPSNPEANMPKGLYRGKRDRSSNTRAYQKVDTIAYPLIPSDPEANMPKGLYRGKRDSSSNVRADRNIE